MWWHIAPEQRAEFLDWHTHEHLPERLGIQGFRRGTRWASLDNPTGFFVMYELQERAVLAGAHYMERLNNPTPWSVKMMPHHQQMVRSLVDVTGSAGAGAGRYALTVRLAPAEGRAQDLRAHLQGRLAALAQMHGVSGAHLLESSMLGEVAVTKEQIIRGGDATASWVVVLCGYDSDALDRLGQDLLSAAALVRAGAQEGAQVDMFALSGTLSGGEAH